MSPALLVISRMPNGAKPVWSGIYREQYSCIRSQTFGETGWFSKRLSSAIGYTNLFRAFVLGARRSSILAEADI